MADTLGIHIDPEGITAVRFDAVSDADPSVVMLSEDGPAAACLVAQDDSGAVVVGDAAARIEGPAVTDPLAVAAEGRIGALGAVINHVVGRAAAAAGTAPRRVAVVVPDDWDAAARARVIEAGGAAGILDMVAVPRSIAAAQRVDIDPVVALAAGAARVASFAAAPLVTREDLGEAITPTPAVTGFSPTDPTTGPVSVFDDEDPAPIPEPPRVAPEPVDASATRTIPAVPGGPPRVPPTPPTAETLRYEPPRRRLSIGAIVAVVLVALIGAVALGLVLLVGGDDDTATDATTTTVAATTSAAPTTSDAPTTTAPDQTTTSSATTTTDAPTTTTTPTTTRPLPVDTPGDITLVETGLQLRGGDLVLFDQNATSAIAAITDLLGDPDRDSDYEISDFCEGARSRFVTWGDLELVFTEDEADSEIGRFTQWYASGHNDPEGLVTFSGVGVTATVGFLQVTFGDALALVQAIPGDPTGLFAATNPGSGAVLNGTTTSVEPNGTVTGLWAGDSCTRVFT